MIRALWLALFFSLTCSAKTFQNSYLRWNLPDNWACVQEAIAWVCQPINGGDAREVVVVATAKMAGPEDNLNSFFNYLRNPKTLISKSKSTMSQPLTVSRRQLAGVEWIQATHRGSEVPNFVTQYMATVKQKLAVLISFSADEEAGAKYKAIFETAMTSMQVDASKPLLVQLQKGNGKAAQDIINTPESAPDADCGKCGTTVHFETSADTKNH